MERAKQNIGGTKNKNAPNNSLGHLGAVLTWISIRGTHTESQIHKWKTQEYLRCPDSRRCSEKDLVVRRIVEGEIRLD
jgi:hypothetical protein